MTSCPLDLLSSCPLVLLSSSPSSVLHQSCVWSDTPHLPCSLQLLCSFVCCYLYCWEMGVTWGKCQTSFMSYSTNLTIFNVSLVLVFLLQLVSWSNVMLLMLKPEVGCIHPLKLNAIFPPIGGKGGKREKIIMFCLMIIFSSNSLFFVLQITCSILLDFFLLLTFSISVLL